MLVMTNIIAVVKNESLKRLERLRSGQMTMQYDSYCRECTTPHSKNFECIVATPLPHGSFNLSKSRKHLIWHLWDDVTFKLR
jgi:hypothetical protein